MHFPVSITAGAVTIPLHPVFETLAFFVGFRYFLFLRKKQGDGISSSNRIWVLIGAIFGALIGSRLVGGLEDPQAMLHSSNKLLYFYANKTVLGGFLGGVWGVEIIKYLIHEKRSSGDLFVFPMILALIIGRIGCFTMGIYEETYGNITSLPVGMDLGDGSFRHPVTLYEIAFLVLLWIVLKAIARRYKLAEGALFKLFMIAYIFFRFFLDFIKPHYTFNIGLSSIQLTCIIGLIYYHRYIIQPKKLLTTYAGS